MARRKGWFAPRRYGNGAGAPFAWRGWALIAGCLVVAVLVATAAEEYPALVFALLLPITSALVLAAARRARGGLGWG